MGSVRDAGQWPGTIARETAKYRGMNAFFNGARSRYRLSTPERIRQPPTRTTKGPRADSLALASTIFRLWIARARHVVGRGT
jgi:hypothetical protein